MSGKFRIKRISDGKTSIGGIYPIFHEYGRSWTLEEIKNHLCRFHDNKWHRYDGCVIIDSDGNETDMLETIVALLKEHYLQQKLEN